MKVQKSLGNQYKRRTETITKGGIKRRKQQHRSHGKPIKSYEKF